MQLNEYAVCFNLNSVKKKNTKRNMWWPVLILWCTATY